MRPTAIRIAVIGDVHDQWDDTDGTILKQLNVHLALFVGDFGNESVDVVRRIARLDLPKAVVLGNHDAWYTATDWGRRKCPYDRTQEDRFQQQLDLLGSDRVGYGLRDFPELGVSVIGGRPCSWGGPTWKYTDFYQTWFGVSSFEESTQRIVESAKRATCNTLIFLGHNGPTGLGDAAEDPCGRDWNPLGGDFGDRDFAEAIATIRGDGKSIPLVTFGHMHHRLRHTKTRLRRSVCFDDAGTLYLNVASVPRVMEIDRRIARNFSIVTLENGCVTDAALCWVDDDSQTLQEIPYQNPSQYSAYTAKRLGGGEAAVS